MHIRHILFDLDGTLLPMNQDEFVTFYMPLLAKKYISEGISFDPKAFIASVWKGYGAMVNNDGSCTNGKHSGGIWTNCFRRIRRILNGLPLISMQMNLTRQLR